MKKTDIGNRMKEYENVFKLYLTKKMPVIIRLDGKAFHTFTRGLQKPFDDIFIKSMWKTAIGLCENIQGCKLAYIQSDEISLLLTDYENINTEPWFNNNLQKMVSISASMATLFFNKSFKKACKTNEMNFKYKDVYEKKIWTAMFDSRAFILPREEVINYFIWRQQDAIRNSIQMIANTNFSHNQLYKKSCNELLKMLFQEKNINWDDMLTYNKRGACIVKEQYNKDYNHELVLKSRWIVDENIPIFVENRDYINKYVLV